MSKSNSSVKIIIGLICVIIAICIASTTIFVIRPYYYENNYIAPVPTNLSTGWSNEPETIFSDFYVSPYGSANGNGSLEHPFATIEQAKSAVRKMKKEQVSHAVIAIMAGTYSIDSVEFTEKDSGTEICRVIYSAYGDGEVIFDGGIQAGTAFEPTDKALIEIDNAKYITFSGITFRNCPGVAVRAKGSNIDISSCTVTNTGSNGIEINGTSITVNGCNISNTGASAITVNGGNRNTLKSGNSSADNNLISSTSRFDKTAPSIIINGTGNSVTHNEIVNSPSTAVYYSGNANKIEYNYIHNTCLVGINIFAVDSPKRWDYYGNFVRYNLISTIGNGTDEVGGICACSGTQVRGNMFINIKGTGISFAGGRDINFTNNILVNCTVPLNYNTSAAGADNKAWEELKKSPYQSDIWKKAYPECAALKTDYADMTDAMFAANPANSIIKDNIVLHKDAEIGTISPEVNNYSNIGDNMLLKLSQTHIFIDAKSGNYRINENSDTSEILPDYKDIPFDSIGRY
ncbi:MAG: right-handed parallel beta-helix repeat-containing protein [Clostridia bacterium]|nr:right-handed parallel beta-helix repeat-containing protein [Clostridia bacterium]